MNLSDALSAIADRKDFAVRRKDGLVVINYLVQMPGTFDGIRADFRGIIFDEATGECVSRPLHKFFNVGQTEDTLFHKLKDLDATIFEKLDGSMIQWLRHGNEIVAATRSGPGTPQAQAAETLGWKLGIMDKIRHLVLSGFTPIFEYLSPRFPIVVRHPAERLVYLCARERQSGTYVFDDDFPDRAERHTFPFAALMDNLNDRQDFEGYVCWLSNRMTVKAKCNWYLERHRAFDAMLRPAYKLYGLALDGVMDDLIAAAQPQHKAPLERVWAEAQGAFLDETNRLTVGYGKIRPIIDEIPDGKLARKVYVKAVRQFYPDDLGPMMSLYDGRPADKAIKARMMGRYREIYPDPLIVGAEDN